MTRSIAAPTGALNYGFSAPASRRPAAWRTSTGQPPSPWTAACWTPSSPWSSWPSTSTYCWWDPRGSARASWPSPWATRHTRGIHRPLRPLRRFLQGHGPGQGGQLSGPHLPVLPDPRPADPVRSGPASYLPPAIGRSVRTDHQPHRVSSFVITSNRAVEEWLSLFDDPILGNSALDRLANASYQIVIEGSSYRERLSPHRKLRGLQAVIDSPTST